MNRPLAFLPTIALINYHLATSVCLANEAEEKIEAARDNLLSCQVTNVKELDDKLTDAREIAFALTNLCIAEYSALNKISARYHFDNSNERRMFSIDQDSEIAKIDASLPIVSLNRNGKLPG